MSEETKTHRCSSCPQDVEHFESELCPSCGRCEDHCVADTHKAMGKVGEG